MTSKTIPVPRSVKHWAVAGLQLKHHAFEGGIDTGERRGRQLARGRSISLKDFKVMRNWFARHGPGATATASGRGTSYQKGNPNGNAVQRFYRWYKSKAHAHIPRRKHRGFVAWCLWGGDAGFLWVQNNATKYLDSNAALDGALSNSAADRAVRSMIHQKKGKLLKDSLFHGGAAAGTVPTKLETSVQALIDLDANKLQNHMTTDEQKVVLYKLLSLLKDQPAFAQKEEKIVKLMAFCFWGPHKWKDYTTQYDIYEARRDKLEEAAKKRFDDGWESINSMAN